MQKSIAGMLQAQKVAENTETVVIYDEDKATVFSARTTHAEISRRLPATCRWVPDYRLIRKMGMLAGWAVCGTIVFFAIIAGSKFGLGVGAYWVAGLMIVASPLVAFVCWDFAPKYRSKRFDYVPFSVVRRITQDAEKPPPHSAWRDTQDTDDGRLTYIVPYAHTFLNLQNPTEERTDERHHPFVARATVLFKDSLMQDATFIMSAKPDAWSRIKSLTLFGVIAVELIFLFLLLNTMSG